MNQASGQIAALDSQLAELGRKSGAVGTALRSMGNAVATAGTAVALVGGYALVTGLQFDVMKQKAQVAFGGLAHDAQQGREFIEQLFNWVRNNTAISFEGAITAATELKARGFELGEIIPILQAVGDQAAALPRPITETVGRITYALGQIRESARLNSQDMRQLTEAGVNAWQYLADQMSVTVGKARQMAKEGEISGREAAKIIIQGMERDFGGMLALQRETAAGQIALAKRTVGELAGEFAKPTFDVLAAQLNNLNNELNKPSVKAQLREYGEIAMQVGRAFVVGFKNTVIPTLQWLGDNSNRIAVAVALIGIAFAWAHPAGAVIIGVGAIITLLGIIKAKNEDLATPLLKVKIWFLEIQVAVQGATDLVGKLASKISSLGGILPDLSGWLKAMGSMAFGPLGAVMGSEGNASITDPNDARTAAEFRLAKAREELNARETESVGIVERVFQAIGWLNAAAVVTAGDVSKLDFGVGALGDQMDSAKKKVDILADGVISFAEAMEANITAAQAGVLEANYDLVTKQQIATFELEKTHARLVATLERNKEAADKLILSLQQETLAKLQSAQSALFGRPTAELAALQAQLAFVNLGAAQSALGNENQLAYLNGQIKLLTDGIESLRQSSARQIQQMQDANEAANRAAQRQIDLDQDRLSAIPNDEAHRAEREALQAKIRREQDAFTAQKQAQSDALDRVRRAIDAEVQAREEQIKSMRRSIEQLTTQYDQLTNHIQLQIAVEQARTAQRQAEALLADRTLLTDEQQAKASDDLNLKIRDLTTKIIENKWSYEYLIPQIQQAYLSFRDLNSVLPSGLPSYAEGGYVGRPTLAIVGDSPGGEWITPARVGPQGNINLTIELDGEIIYRAVQLRQTDEIRLRQRGV